MAITNANEGQVFVDQTAPVTLNTTEYIRQLFPLLGDDDIKTGAELYAMTGLDAAKQSTLVHSEGQYSFSYEEKKNISLLLICSYLRLSDVLPTQRFRW